MGMNLTWQEAYQQAIGETAYAYSGKAPSKTEFLETFETFYDELMAECLITSWPVDPPGSHRMAKSRAAAVWADKGEGREKERGQ